MFSALKKLTKGGDDRCPAPVPMSSSLQKKFSRGVHFNMKILIKGDRNVGKSCLLQRLQGGQFIEEYVPTDQIQAAPIHWTYKNTDHIVKVEVWEVVDKGRAKKKPPLGLKLENQSAPAAEDGYDAPVLDATFLDVYKNANGVILMFDITKPWTFDYVVKELSRAPSDLPAVVLGNHCDMQHHRQVHAHHVDTAVHHARLTRTAPVRYAESSMRNGFGLRLLHKFLSVPFLRLQRSSLLEQLQRNQREVEEAERELDDFQKSEEAHYNSFVDRLASKRRESAPPPAAAGERSPSIVVGGGRPIVPPDVNPLLAQSLNPKVVKAQLSPPGAQPSQRQTQYASPELLQPKLPDLEAGGAARKHVEPKTESVEPTSGVDGALDEFYAGTLDSSFLDDSAPPDTKQDSYAIDSDSDEADRINPMVTIDQDDLDIVFTPTLSTLDPSRRQDVHDQFTGLNLLERERQRSTTMDQHPELSLDNDFPLWAGDSSARRSPEGGEDPDPAKETGEKVQKKHKKKKSKEKGDYSDKAEKKEKKRHKKALALVGEKRNPQLDLLPSAGATYDNVEYDDYDSI